MDSDVTLIDLVSGYGVLDIGNTVFTSFPSGVGTTIDVTVPNDSRGTPARACRILRSAGDTVALRMKPYVTGSAPANTNLTILNPNRPVVLYTGGATTIRFHRDVAGGSISLYVTPLENL